MTPRAAITPLSLARRIHKLEQTFQNRPPRGQRLITLRFVDLLRRSANLTEAEQREFDDWEPELRQMEAGSARCHAAEEPDEVPITGW